MLKKYRLWLDDVRPIPEWMENSNCIWLDNRRRNAYYKYLSTKGYQYGRIDGEKCIFKRYKKGTESNDQI